MTSHFAFRFIIRFYSVRRMLTYQAIRTVPSCPTDVWMMDKALLRPTRFPRWEWLNKREEWNFTLLRERERFRFRSSTSTYLLMNLKPSAPALPARSRPLAYQGHSQNLGTKPGRATMWSWGKSFIRPPPRRLQCMENSRARLPCQPCLLH